MYTGAAGGVASKTTAAHARGVCTTRGGGLKRGGAKTNKYRVYYRKSVSLHNIIIRRIKKKLKKRSKKRDLSFRLFLTKEVPKSSCVHMCHTCNSQLLRVGAAAAKLPYI